MAEVEDDATPPVGEEIHLPGPSILPLLAAIGVTAMVIGTTLGWWLSIIGLILLVVTTGIWIRDTRRDIDDLPEDHGH
jgi:Cytochrome c oxidase subunit IV